MGHKFAEMTFTPAVHAVQLAQGSHDVYEKMLGGETYSHVLGEWETRFIQERDSFYMASISESGWPYIQHRGGPAGFIKILDDKTIGFADFRGNRQYISTGNILSNDRVALFFMDYPNRTRLKVLGLAEVVDLNESELIAKLEDEHYRAQVERGIVIHIEAFDWNCPQHITPRYTDDHIRKRLEALTGEKEPGNTPHKKTFTYPNNIGNGLLPLVITGVRQLASNIRAYELRDPEGSELPEVSAGTHIQIPVLLENGNTVFRHYSICSNPNRTDMYEIAVLEKQQENSASRAIHKYFNIGMQLNCQYPENHFELHQDNRPAILIAGGIGITPIKSITQLLKSRGTDLHLYYAGRNRKDMAFRDRLERELGDDITIFSSEDGEHMNINSILTSASSNTMIYACGPQRLLDDVITSANRQHIDKKQIRIEKFVAEVGNHAKPFNVELRRSGMTLEVSTSQSLLDALLEAGIDIPYNCRTGSCKTCMVKVLEGDAEHHDVALSAEEREQANMMCPCVSRAYGDSLVLDL